MQRHLAAFKTTLLAETGNGALALGAARIDIGQGATPWVVMADPEANEFCVLSVRSEPATS